MVTKNIIKQDSYKDSVFLMQISGELEKTGRLAAVSLMMGTDANKEILAASELLTDSGQNAKNNDLIIALSFKDDADIEYALDYIEEKFKAPDTGQDNTQIKPATLEAALQKMPESNLAIISVAGQYAAREASKALDHNLHVMIFSDNVTIDEELFLKQKAFSRDLLLMGPDCGTSIINNVPLGFANKIPKGNIGLVAASGTGLQEVTVTIAKYGSGITQAFGTGGRDLSGKIGGLTMLKCLEYLSGDPASEVIVLISKPPDSEIAEKVIKSAKNSGKPTVICFMGSEGYRSEDNLYFTDTLEAAGITAADLSQKGKTAEIPAFTLSGIDELIASAKSRIKPGEKYLRGLYSGGTLCDESIYILNKGGLFPYSNAGNNPEFYLKDLEQSVEHTLLDMGEDEFTRGRPHPMIDLGLRNKRILAEAAKDDVAVILFDLVLGYGANSDPAGSMQNTLSRIKDSKILVASVCGTEDDPQIYSKQAEILDDCGVIVLPTNAQAARFTMEILS